MNTKKYCFILIILLALAFTLRMVNLTQESIWLDEGYALRNALQPTLRDFIDVVRYHDGTPPLYYLFLRYWIDIFGASEFSIRFPSVIFSTLSILLLYLIGKEWFGKKEALLACLIMAVSMIHILYAQEARPYALFTFMTLLSIYAYTLLLKKDNIKNRMFYSISSAMLLYTHNLGIFIVFMQSIFYFTFIENFKIKIKDWAISQGAIALLYLPNIPILLGQISHVNLSLRGALEYKLGLPIFIAKLGAFNLIFPLLIGFLIFALFLIIKEKKGIKFKLKSIKKWKGSNILSALLIFIMVFGLYALPKLTAPFFLTRYTHFLYPILYLLAAFSFFRIQKKMLKYTVAALFIAMIFSTLFTYYDTYPRKEPWKDVAAYLEEEVSEGDILVLIAGDVRLALDNYYLNKTQVIGVKLPPSLDENTAELESLKKQLEDQKGIVMVLSHAHRAQGIYDGYFGNNYEKVKEKRFKDIDVYRYKKI